MAFPEDKLDHRVEVLLGGTWTDITQWVFGRDGGGVTISGGRSDEARQVEPGRLDMEINNQGGRFSPRNPLSPYFGQLGRNTPMRHSLRGPTPYLLVPDESGARASVASTSAMDVTDLDVAVEISLDRLPAQLSPAAVTPYGESAMEIIGRFNASDSARMWRLNIGSWGTPELAWSVNGAGGFPAILATAPVPYASGERFALRATLDVDDGAGSHVVTFYLAPSLAGPWTLLGDPIVAAGTTSINTTGNADLQVGDLSTQSFARGSGAYFGVQLRDGIDGALLVAADFTGQEPGTTSFTDGAGRAWTVQGPAEITDWYRRFEGEVPAWPPRWDVTGRDVWVPVEAAGILRRLGQGAKSLQSVLRRVIASHPETLGYWPCEDGRDATSIAPGLPGLRVATAAGLSMAAESGLPSSAPLPRIGSDGGSFRVSLPSLPTPSLGWRAEMVYFMDELPETSLGWFRVWTSGGGAARVTGYIGAGEARIRVHDVDGAVIAEQFWTDPTALAAATAGWCRVRLVAIPITGGWDYRVWWTPIGQSQHWYTNTASAVGPLPFTRPVRIDNVWASGMSSMPVGHIVYVNNPDTDVYGSGSGGPDTGYDGERALSRMRRLAQEERLPLSVLGQSPGSPRMGPQRIGTLLDLIQECVEADGGLLYERREVLGLQYRARAVRYNPRPTLELDYAAGHLSPGLEPTDDDDGVTNDVTVTREGGSSAQAVLAEGPLSVTAIGLYDSAVTLNVADDSMLDGLAHWRLHMGTVDAQRYPLVRLNLARVPQFVRQVLSLQAGTRLTIANPPPWLPPGAIDLIVQGYAEAMTQREWEVSLNCSPGLPWVVGQIGGEDPAENDAPTHVDTDGSELDAAVDAAATGLIVQTTVGLPWTTTAGPAPSAAAGDLPVDLVMAGEVVTAQAIEPFAWDTFQRTFTGGWGATPSGITPTPEWVASGGLAAERSVSGSQGIVSVGTTVATRFQLLSPWSVPDLEMAVTVTPAALATGASLTSMLVARITGSDYYAVRLDLGTSGAVGIEAVRSGTSLSGLLPTGLTYTAGTALRMRMRVDGDRIRGRVWPVGRPEPGGWSVDWTVSSGQITTGLLAVTAARLASNTNADAQFSFSRFEVSNPQFMTVARSVNRIVKPHAAGADVRLANPMIIAL